MTHPLPTLTINPHPHGLIQRSLQQPLSLFLSLGLLAGGLFAAPAAPAMPPSENPIGGNTSHAVADGTYLYGESPLPDQIGQAYMVMTVQDGRMVGALYMPSSSFDCFYGEMTGQTLALTIVDSYERTLHPYEVALVSDGLVAAPNGAATALVPEGMHPIASLSEQDREILAVCQTNHPL